MFKMTDENWRKQNKTIASKMKVILRQEIFTDTVFVVRGREFKCHKLILAVGSPYFERTFYHTFRNSDSPPIVISDITPDAFQCVLNFLYTDKITFGNEKQAFEAYEAAEKFQMADLKSECVMYLSELDFRPVTIWNNLERATALEMKKLQQKYMNYIQNNTSACLKEDAFLNASGDVVMQIMQFERLPISELELANRISAWGETKNPRFLKVIMDPYLRLFRFKAMTPKEFCTFIKNHQDLLSSSAILQHLELPCKNALPSWCSRMPRRMWPV